jgi:outer membrane protein assembly factor BamB
LWAQPVTDGKYVFVTSLDHTVSAVDIETYAVVWHGDLPAAVPGSPAIGEDGMLYVGSLASQLEKFDPATGKHETALTAKDWVWSTPVTDGDALYFGDVAGNFYSLSISTGGLNWSIQPDGPITANAILQNDHLLLATESGNIYAIGKDGSTLWFDTIGGQLYTTPVVSNDMIIVAPLGAQFQLVALNSDGRQVWTFTPGK